MSATALILTGGASRRFGSHKPSARWRGRALVSYTLAATAHLDQIVIGSSDDIPAEIPVVLENPPGGGPVAAIAAGVRAKQSAPVSVLLAADLPLITRDHVDQLLAAVKHSPAVFVDADGRAQWLAAAWPTPLLVTSLAQLGNPAGRSLRALYELAVPVRIADSTQAASTDIDTVAELEALSRNGRAEPVAGAFQPNDH